MVPKKFEQLSANKFLNRSLSQTNVFLPVAVL